MSQYFGDFAEDDTVNIPFNTFSSDDPAASVTITNLVDADIKVHKDANATPIVTDGATIAIDFASITGNHIATIDTSADAAYATGSEYQVRIEGTTIDGGTINAWIGCFSIERAGGAIALLTGTNSLANIEDKIDIIDTNVDAILVDTAEIGVQGAGLLDLGGMSTAMKAEVNAECDTALTDYDGPTNAEMVARTLLAASYFDPAADAVANVTLVATTTTNTDMVGTDDAFLAASAPTNFSSLVITAGGAADALVQGFLNNTIAETTADNIAANFEIFFDNADAISTQVQDDVGGGAGGTDWTASERQELRGRLGITGSTAAGGNTPTLSLQATVDTILVDTADMQPKLGTPASNISADIAAVKVDTAAILVDTGTTIPATLAALNDIAVADIFTNVMENSETFAEQVKLMRAESCGKVSVSGAIVTFRNAADDGDRITSTTDSNGQRTAVTVDGS